MAQDVSSSQFETMVQAYAVVAVKLNAANPGAATEELAALKVVKTAKPDSVPPLEDAYTTVMAKLNGTNPHAEVKQTKVKEEIKGTTHLKLEGHAAVGVATTTTNTGPNVKLADLRRQIGAEPRPGTLEPEYFLEGLAKEYTATVANVLRADLHIDDELNALREMIGKPSDPIQYDALVQAYRAVVAKLQEDDSRAAKERVMLFEMINETRATEKSNRLDSRRLIALSEAYAAVAAKLTGADPGASQVLAALSEAALIAPTNLRFFVNVYTEVATHIRLVTASPKADIAALLWRVSDVRTSDQCTELVKAIIAAMQLGSPPLDWNDAGLVVAAILLNPVSAGEPTVVLINEYERLIGQRSDAPKLVVTWAGDVWAFVEWARRNLHGFDPHHPSVGFLPQVQVFHQSAAGTPVAK